jgi:hypothetical protein
MDMPPPPPQATEPAPPVPGSRPRVAQWDEPRWTQPNVSPTDSGPPNRMWWQRVLAIAGLVFLFPFLLTIPFWIELGRYRKWKSGEIQRLPFLMAWGAFASVVVLLAIAVPADGAPESPTVVAASVPSIPGGIAPPGGSTPWAPLEPGCIDKADLDSHLRQIGGLAQKAATSLKAGNLGVAAGSMTRAADASRATADLTEADPKVEKAFLNFADRLDEVAAALAGHSWPRFQSAMEAEVVSRHNLTAALRRSTVAVC